MRLKMSAKPRKGREVSGRERDKKRMNELRSDG